MQTYLDPDQYNKGVPPSNTNPVAPGLLNSGPPASQGVPAPQVLQPPPGMPNPQTPTSGNIPPPQIPGGVPPMYRGIPQQQPQLPVNPSLSGAPINPTPTGTNIPGIIPTAGMPTMGQMGANKPNGWTPPPGFMDTPQNYRLHPENDPANHSGIWQEAYAKGIIARHEMDRQDQAQANANETQSWNRQQFTKQQQIQMGMQQAAAKGGYGGVIDYLNTADPEQSLKIQQQKNDLDQSMLKNQSLAMLNKQQQQTALFQGYGLLGKMGATILAAPAAERQQLYTQMLPMVKAVNPDAPSNLTAATPMLMLGAGQAMPDSAIWQAKKDATDSLTGIAKAQTDLNNYFKNGGKPTDPTALALTAKINEPIQDYMTKQATVDELATRKANNAADTSNKALSTINTISKNYNDNPITKNYMTFDQKWQPFLAAQQMYQQNPQDPAAVKAMSAAMAGLNQIRRVNPQVANWFVQNGSGINKKLDEWESIWNKGGEVVADPNSIGQMAQVGNQLHQNMATNMDKVTNIYKSQADAFDNPIKDSKGNMVHTKDQIPWIDTGGVTPATQQNIPSIADIQNGAASALARGADPTAVQQRTMQLKQKFGYQ